VKVERERGIALLMVLWVLLLLALLAAIFGANARTEVHLARNLVENAQAEALADAGVYRAITGLTMEPQEGGFRGDGRVYTWHATGGEVRFSIRDEGGKIDLNQAPPILLRELFIAVGVDPRLSMDLAEAIIDFRDEDEKGRNGAERREYESAGPSHGPKNEPFQLVDELIYVLGMTPDLYRRVAPLLTVRGQEERPHPYTAPLEVRTAMIAAQASRTRSGRAGGRGTGRSSRTESAGMTEDVLADLGGADADADLGSRTRSGVPVFTIHAEGRIASGAVFAREAIVDFAGGENLPFVVRAWRQADRILFPLHQTAETAP
jgi:general secretion pathway protein K